MYDDKTLVELSLSPLIRYCELATALTPWIRIRILCPSLISNAHSSISPASSSRFSRPNLTMRSDLICSGDWPNLDL